MSPFSGRPRLSERVTGASWLSWSDPVPFWVWFVSMSFFIICIVVFFNILNYNYPLEETEKIASYSRLILFIVSDWCT